MAYRAVLLDIAGVLTAGSEPVPGAVEAVQRLRRAGMTLRFVTNTSRRPATAVLESLRASGFSIEPNELFTAPQAARRWLQAHGHHPFLIVHPDIEGEFEDLSVEAPDAVLLADAEDGLSYQNLDKAFALLLEGAPLLAIGDNRYFKGPERLHLDAGPFVRALEYAANVEAQIAGKPSALFFERVVADTGLEPSETLMVGDDRVADIIGAVEAGIDACLVRTGKFRPGDDAGLPARARVEDSIVELADALLATP